MSDFETIDLITPNRLRLGRNNERSSVGTLHVNDDPKKILKANTQMFNSWFDNWLVSQVPKLMKQPKRFKSDLDNKHGNVDLFLKNDSINISIWLCKGNTSWKRQYNSKSKSYV